MPWCEWKWRSLISATSYDWTKPGPKNVPNQSCNRRHNRRVTRCHTSNAKNMNRQSTKRFRRYAPKSRGESEPYATKTSWRTQQRNWRNSTELPERILCAGETHRKGRANDLFSIDCPESYWELRERRCFYCSRPTPRKIEQVHASRLASYMHECQVSLIRRFKATCAAYRNHLWSNRGDTWHQKDAEEIWLQLHWQACQIRATSRGKIASSPRRCVWYVSRLSKMYKNSQ